MKKKRFAVEQIVAVLKQPELRMPVADLIHQVGISEQTFYRWKSKYSGLEVSVADAIRSIAAWRLEYNRHRPHSALNNLTPEEFAQRAA